MALPKSPLCVALVATTFAACAPSSSVSGRVAPPKMRLRYNPDAPVVPAPAAAPKLTYYGGHVISNPKVYVVNWGAGVASTITSQVDGFYTTVLNSTYEDWLNEYNTGASGTNQSIGRGTYGGQIIISPSQTTGTIDDSAVQTEL